MSYALITIIENNVNNLNNQQGVYSNPRLYADEAVLCFQNWRKNAGWLKDIPIYAICPTKNILSTEEKSKIESLGVTYLEEYMKETEDFFCGFWNVPLVMKWCEENLQEETFIHIDLDMNIIKPLPQSLVDNELPICGIYDINSAKDQRPLPENWSRPFDTGFTISRKNSGFYKLFYDVLTELTKTPDDIWNEYCKDRPIQDIEEYAMDKIYNEQMIDMNTIEKYQIGEGYAKVSTLTNDELQDVYFWHEHILFNKDYDKIREKIEFQKRMRAI